MIKHNLRNIFNVLLFACSSFLIAFLAACTPQPITSENSNSTTIIPVATPSTVIVAHVPTEVTSPDKAKQASLPHDRPHVILTPTPIPGGSKQSQQVILSDRTLWIEDVAMQTRGETTSVKIKLTIRNTSPKAIENQTSFYQLVGKYGDMFGLPPDTNSGFFRIVKQKQAQSGVLLFEHLPQAAIQQPLRLMYRSEVAAQTIFVPLSL